MNTGTTPAKASQLERFSIVQRYHDLLSSDHDLTPPIAAIESLIELLASTPSTTVSETLDLLQNASNTLRQNIPNWISLSAGADLFQRYLVTTLQRPGALGPGGDIGLIRQHLISNSRLFVQRAREARSKIAVHALPFITDETTVFTYNYSRAVSSSIRHAAETGRYFRVINIQSPSAGSENASTSQKPPPTPSASLPSEIPTARIPLHHAAYALSTSTTPHDPFGSSPHWTPKILIVGASAVLENGGIVAGMGTYQLAILAHALRVPFYVATESYKFVRMHPLSQQDLPIHQRAIKFSGGDNKDDGDAARRRTERFGGDDVGKGKEGDEQKNQVVPDGEMIDLTPPELIRALITENGVMTPSAVSEELIKLWL